MPRSGQSRPAKPSYAHFVSVADALHELRRRFAESTPSRGVGAREMLEVVRRHNPHLSEEDLRRVELNARSAADARRRLHAVAGVEPKSLFSMAFGKPFPANIPEQALQVRFSPYSVNFILDCSSFDFRDYLGDWEPWVRGYSAPRAATSAMDGLVNVVFAGGRNVSRHETRHSFNRQSGVVGPLSAAHEKHLLFRGADSKLLRSLEQFMRDELVARTVESGPFRFGPATFDTYVNNCFGIPSTPKKMNSFAQRMLRTDYHYVSSEESYDLFRRQFFPEQLATAEKLRPTIEKAVAAIAEAQAKGIPRQVLADFVAMVPLHLMPRRLPRIIEEYRRAHPQE
ncbi:MAG: hypothetical protein HY394_02080 [Candidatus Diapherotrites archaeon]|nr:hypothetical protein [Candidatus Diapherotrites archaeon]